MSRIAIVGGHGKIARHLIALLAAEGHTPLALVRNLDYSAELEGIGATVGILDIEQSADVDFAAAFEGCDAIVFAAGGGPDGNIDRKRAVDLQGSLKSIAGAKIAGVHRFVQVSAIGVDKPVAEGTDEVWAAYVEAKRDADVALRESGLAWTIIRPGALTDDEPIGLVSIAAETGRASIPRGDVAAIIAAVLDDARTIGQQWEAVGGDATIREAIDAQV